MRLPEHMYNEIRKNFGEDKHLVAMFFNSIFLSIDEKPKDDNDMIYQIEDKSQPDNSPMLNLFLVSLLKKLWNLME